MTFIPRDDLERLEKRRIEEPCWKIRMWRRSYCVALNAVKVLEQRVGRLRQQHWDTPMTLFYPEIESNPAAAESGGAP
jgi:transposase InsO family protein